MFSDPKNNIKQLGLTEGMSVADFGSGAGHYTLALSQVLGDTGRVYAIDIQKTLLQKIKNIASTENRHNIDILWGDMEQVGGTKLADNSTDAVVLANDLFQVEEKNNVAMEIRRILKPGGKLMVVDWADSFGGIGPAGADIVVESTAKKLFEDIGLRFISRFDEGEHHYGLIFKKS